MNYVAVGNDELGDKLGKTINCPSCGGQHDIKCSSEDPANEGRIATLQYYKCGDTTYLAGINGKAMPKRNSTND